MAAGRTAADHKVIFLELLFSLVLFIHNSFLEQNCENFNSWVHAKL